ncbi:MAG TPA: hypothetical protein V6C96_04530 [Vampirovibrionales bacterium]
MNKWINNLKKKLDEREETFVGFVSSHNSNNSEKLNKVDKEDETFVSFVSSKNSDNAEILESGNYNSSFEEALKNVFGIDLDDLSKEFSADEKKVCSFLLDRGLVFKHQIAYGTNLSRKKVEETIEKLTILRYLITEEGKYALCVFGREQVKKILNIPKKATDKTDKSPGRNTSSTQNNQNIPQKVTDKTDKSPSEDTVTLGYQGKLSLFDKEDY